MKKFVYIILLSTMILSCDPMSLSKIFAVNRSSYNLLIKLNIYDRGKEQISILKGEIKEITKIIILGNRAPKPSEYITSLKIYNSDNGSFLASIKNKNIYKRFEVKKVSWGTEIERYLIIITDKTLK